MTQTPDNLTETEAALLADEPRTRGGIRRGVAYAPVEGDETTGRKAIPLVDVRDLTPDELGW